MHCNALHVLGSVNFCRWEVHFQELSGRPLRLRLSTTIFLWGVVSFESLVLRSAEPPTATAGTRWFLASKTCFLQYLGNAVRLEMAWDECKGTADSLELNNKEHLHYSWLFCLDQAYLLQSQCLVARFARQTWKLPTQRLVVEILDILALWHCKSTTTHADPMRKPKRTERRIGRTKMWLPVRRLRSYVRLMMWLDFYHFLAIWIQGRWWDVAILVLRLGLIGEGHGVHFQSIFGASFRVFFRLLRKYWVSKKCIFECQKS